MADATVPAGASSVMDHALDEGVFVLPVEAPVEAPHTSRRELVHALMLFAAVGALVWLAVWFGNAHLGHDPWFPHRSVAGGQLFEGWARWDAVWYRTIVREGYVYYPGVQSSVAFWPSYPVVVKAFSGLFPSIFITGTVVTLVSGATLAVLFRKWAGMFLAPAAAATALVLLLVYPYGWYQYGAVYADALFIAAAVGAFVLVERDRLFWAGIVGIVATAGRPAGLVVAAALVIRVIERRNAARGERGFRAALDPRGIRRSDAPVLLAFAGVGAWCAFLWVRFGNPFLFASVEASNGWDQGAGPRTWLKFELIEVLEHHPFSLNTLNLVAQGVLVIGALTLVPAVKRRFGWAYAMYVLGVCGMALVGTKDFMGSGRYLLSAFPLFAVAGDLLCRRRSARMVLVPLSLVALVGMAMLFGRGSYLS
jgi:hypothetical protein